MQSLIQHLLNAQASGIRTIIVVGAGDGAALPWLRKLDSPRMLLVEAHPEQLSLLSRRIEAALGEEILPVAATASRQAHATLFLCNNPRYSSLHAPRELRTHFPNLEMTGESDVPATPLPEIIANFAGDAGTGKLLVLDAPGQSLDLLRSVPGEVLQTFDWIIACTADAPLYDGDNAGECLSTLDGMGFDVAAEDQSAIAPERRVLLQRHDAKVQRARLVAERDKLSGQLAQLERHHEEELARLAARQKQESDAHQSQVAALTAERDRNDKLAAEHKAELDKLTAELKKDADDHASQLAALIAERDFNARLADERKAELDKIARQNQDRGARIAQLECENAELGKRQNHLDQEMSKAAAQIDLIKEVWLRETSA